jgi:hypothetical protein
MRTFPDGTTHRRYDVRGERGQWLATVFLGADGVFSTVSDYGNYGYWWSAIGGDGDIRRFLLRSEEDPGYFRIKLDASTEYDGEATEGEVRKAMLQWRREGTLTKEQARQEWEIADYARADFRDWHDATDMDVYPDDFYRDRPNPQAVAFVEKVMPRLCEMLRAELAAEKAVA